MSSTEDDGAYDDGSFFKALPSDVDDAISLKLLLDVYETNEMWGDFVEEDIQQVVEVFSILNMTAGEKLIQKGEYATFCGIVLQGTFNAIVTPTFTVGLRAGDMVGEMSLFEGGSRNADIITGSDPEGCILAVITFADLDNLAMLERYSQLARKLINMFAKASIKKLRGMIPSSGPPPATPTAGATGAPTTTATTPTNASAAATTPAINVAAAEAGVSAVPTSPTAVAAAKAEAKKKRTAAKAEKPVVAETLYKNKMNKNSAAATTSPDGTAAPKNINEAQAKLEEQQHKLKKAEHAKRNQQVMLDKSAKQVKQLEEATRQQEETIARLTTELKTATESLKDITVKYDKQCKLLEDAVASSEKDKKIRIEIESKFMLSQADLAAKTEGDLVRLRADLDAVTKQKSDLEVTLAGEKATLAALMQAKESESAKFTHANAELTAAVDRLTKDLQLTRAKLEASETELKAVGKTSDERLVGLSNQNHRLLDLEEKLSAAMSWKLKALEFQSGLDAEKKRHIRLSDEWNKQSRELETELKHYKLLLKTFTITIYAKEFRLRKLIGNLHKRVSEMLLTTLEEHYNTSTGKEKGMKGATTGTGAAGGNITSTFKSVRKRKKAYLDNLLKPSSKLRDVVSSLDDEVSKLKGPFEEIRERCLHWRATSESFFQRNIDLASKLMTLDKSLTETSKEKEHVADKMKQQAKDYEKLQARHSELSARVHSSNAASNNGVTSAPGTGAHTGADASNSKDAQSKKQELELLEARATVLRVHIQQLEHHYLQLQAAIHNFSSAQQQQQPSSQHANFQESKQSSSSGDFHDRFDPALVSPVPFPSYAGQPPFPQQQSSLSSPRGPILLAPRGAPAPIIYQPQLNVNAGGVGGTPQRYPYSGGPISPSSQKPDVISLRALREQQIQYQPLPPQQSQSYAKFPPVAGAYPPYPPYAQQQQQSSPSPPHPSAQPVPPSSNATTAASNSNSNVLTLNTPQRTTTLTFSPAR